MKSLGKAIVFSLLVVAWSYPSQEKNNGFLRLLRRSDPENEKTLIRQERKASDEDDDFDFFNANKRKDEDSFYKTLLSRTDTKKTEKRSFDTEDVERKEGVIIRQDWNGDSKISDADKRELESLFDTLNAEDEEKVKIDKVRDAGEEPEQGVKRAARDYTSWLMSKPASKMSEALNHKVDVDYELSKLLYARSSIPGKPCRDNDPQCRCKITCYPYAVSKSTPCQCSPLMTKSIQPTLAKAKAENKAKNVVITGPALSRKKSQLGGQGRAAVALPPLCHENTADCLCSRACYPKQVVLSKPCECGSPIQNNTAPQARSPVASAPAKPAAPSPVAVASPSNPNSPVQPYVSPVKSAHLTPIGHPMPAPIPMGPRAQPVGKAAVQPSQVSSPPDVKAVAGNAALSTKKEEICSDGSSRCVCAKACFPRPVTNPNPCECGIGSPPPPPPPPPSGGGAKLASSRTVPVANGPVADAGSVAWCKKACHPRLISSARPCECSLNNSPPAPSSAKVVPAKMLSSPSAMNRLQIPLAVAPRPNAAQILCARKCIPGAPCDCGAGGSSNPPPPSPAPAPAPAPAVPYAKPQVATPLKPCTRKCVPGVANNPGPCDCEAGGSAPPPPPAPAPAPAPAAAPSRLQQPSAHEACARTCYPNAVASSSPCDCQAGGSSPPPPPPPAPSGAPSRFAAPVANAYAANRAAPINPAMAAYYQRAQPQAWNRAPYQVPYAAQAQLASQYQGRMPYAAGGRVPYPGFRAAAASFRPVPQQSLSQVSAAAAAARSTFLEKKALGISLLPKLSEKAYQGCYKDMKPVRDLPRRFTRYGNVMTNEACVNECKYQGYKFAGAQYGYLCFCGNGFGRYGKVDDKLCNARCYGDQKTKCGAFWHNSVYSVDGNEYDPTDFDFKKIDAEEAKKDQMAASKKLETDSSRFPSKMKSEVAEHLMKAAEAALKAAKKLIPDGKQVPVGGKYKREDDDDDEALQENKLAAMASLGAAKQLLEKESIIDKKKHEDKERRSADLDSEVVDPDNGKDVLVAYLGGLEEYNRQTRSIDDDDESGSGEENAKSEAERFAYQRVHLGESGDGEFIDKASDVEEDGDADEDKRRKRSSEDSNQEGSGSEKTSTVEKRSVPPMKETDTSKVQKRSTEIEKPQQEIKGKIRRRSRRSLDVESEGDETINISNNGITSFRRSRSVQSEASGDSFPTDDSLSPDEQTHTDKKSQGIIASSAAKDDEGKTKRSTRASETDSSEEDYIPVKKGEDITKRSAEEKLELKDHVKKGVHNLLNLVIELYKQQKTVKAFEESVHSLKEDIVRQLDVPVAKKDTVMKQVRDEIKATAVDELRALTSTIKSEIRQYGDGNPQLGKQVNAAVSLMPDLPLSKMKKRQIRKEIKKRAAELEVTEDDFTAADVPDLVKEHFKRNVEDEFHGEKRLSRMHRDVSDENDFDEDFKEIMK